MKDLEKEKKQKKEYYKKNRKAILKKQKEFQKRTGQKKKWYQDHKEEEKERGRVNYQRKLRGELPIRKLSIGNDASSGRQIDSPEILQQLFFHRRENYQLIHFFVFSIRNKGGDKLPKIDLTPISICQFKSLSVEIWACSKTI